MNPPITALTKDIAQTPLLAELLWGLFVKSLKCRAVYLLGGSKGLACRGMQRGNCPEK